MPEKIDSDTYEYTPEEQSAIRAKARSLRSRGQSQAALQLLARMNAGEYIEGWEYKVTNVRPEKPVLNDADLVMPPTTGKGSTVGAWREFANNISSMEPEVIDNMTRTEIITVLEEQGLIDLEGEVEADIEDE